jgi:hypothetical protein
MVFLGVRAQKGGKYVIRDAEVTEQGSWSLLLLAREGASAVYQHLAITSNKPHSRQHHDFRF